MVLLEKIKVTEDVKSRLTAILKLKDFSETSDLLGLGITRTNRDELTVDQ